MRKVILSLALCVSMCGISGLVKAESFPGFDTYIESVNKALILGDGTATTIKGLIKNYCTAVYTTDWFTENSFTYSGKQSVFVYLLCLNVTPGSIAGDLPEWFTEGAAGYFKLSSFLELGIQDRRPLSEHSASLTDFCSPALNLGQCNLSKYIPKLFNMIINDYVNLKQPQMYGFAPPLDADEEAGANAFSKNYFNGLEICSTANAERQYPQTCKKLKQYIKQAKRTLADVQIFRSSELLSKSDAKVCDAADPAYSLLLCGLYGDTSTSLQQFLNLTYNELFYYRLFMTYYTTMIQSKTELLWLTQATAGPEISKRVTAFANEFTRSQQALAMTIRMLRDQYAAFPLHIWFLMYQEDLQKLANPLAQLYTPLTQLYHTLQNVQKKE